jgi:hypothetical protein
LKLALVLLLERVDEVPHYLVLPMPTITSTVRPLFCPGSGLKDENRWDTSVDLLAE